MLRKAGFRFISGRPVHPKADVERQREFVAGLKAQVTSTLNPEALASPLEIRFQNEACVGQKGDDGAGLGEWEAASAHRARPPLWLRLSVRRHLRGARRRHRPWGGQGERGVDEPASGRVGAVVAPGAHAVIALDRAGWHRSGDLLVPPNLTLLHRPPTVWNSIQWRRSFYS